MKVYCAVMRVVRVLPSFRSRKSSHTIALIFHVKKLAKVLS